MVTPPEDPVKANTIFHLLMLHRLLIALSSYIIIFGNCLNYIVQKKQEKNLVFLLLLQQKNSAANKNHMEWQEK